MNKSKVLSINITRGKGTKKEPLEEGLFIADFGLQNDSHGGKGNRQVSFLDQETIDEMKNLGIEGLCFGNFSENITTKGISLSELHLGDKLNIGETIHEITQIGKECHANDGCKLFQRFGKCIMPKQIIFTKVLKGGKVKVGDQIEVLK